MKLRWRIGLTLWMVSSLGRGADFPPLELPAGVGVNIHFTRGHERDLDLIAAAGFRFIRMDFGWGGIERQKDHYNWADYEALLRGLEQRGLRAIFILDYSNGLYEPAGAAPQHPESIAAFARWAGAAARHFQGRRILWEIWNEPNISFWKPKPDVHQYLALARATCQAIRENDPQATIIAPASSEFPWAFFEALFQGGLLAQLDGVSVHPYRNYQRGPETAGEDYLKLRALIERYAPPERRAMPILSGEWGYATHRKGVSLDTQAAFAVRQQLANLLNRIPLSIWYDWKNDGSNPDNGEHNFGTVDTELRPKPAYAALQLMTRQLAGFHLAHRLEVGRPEAYVLLLVNAAGEQKLACWSSASDEQVSLEVGLDSPAAITLVDGRGEPQPVDLKQGRLQLSLQSLPSYATFKAKSPALSAAAAWSLSEPFARSVPGGVKNGLAFALQVQNPFAHPIQLEAGLALPDSQASKTVKLGPGKTTQLKLAGTIARRDRATVPAELTVQIRDGAGKSIGRSAERLLFTLANPIQLSAAPVGNGLRLTVADVAGAGFNGVVQTGPQKRPISLTPAATTASVTFSMPDCRPGADRVAGPFDLVAKKGETVARLPAVRYQPLPATNYQARLDGDDKIQATASLRSATAPGPDAPFATVFALDYEFADGWRFVRCEPGTPVRFERRPAAIGGWVYSDHSGNYLRLRLRDSAGQTFQPSGPKLDWSGWRWVTFDLEQLGEAGHWGGANDGVPRGELTLDTALLLDGPRHATSGRIYFAGLTAIY